MEALNNAWYGSWRPLTNLMQTFQVCHLCTFYVATIFFLLGGGGHPYIWHHDSAENLQGRKLQRILRFCGHSQKFFGKIRECGIFWQHQWAICESFKSFLIWKFSTIRLLLHVSMNAVPEWRADTWVNSHWIFYKHSNKCSKQNISTNLFRMAWVVKQAYQVKPQSCWLRNFYCTC